MGPGCSEPKRPRARSHTRLSIAADGAVPTLGPGGGDLHEGPAKRREAAGKAKKVAKTRVGSWNRPEVRRYNPAHFEGRPPGPPSPFG
jgi:hypothetical protein